MIIAPLGENRALCYDKFFPSPFHPSSKRYEVVIGVGGNLGEVPRSLQRLFRALQKAKRVDIISTSPLYYNPAFGYTEQAPFYNATMRLGWSGGYGEFFAYTSYLERRFGRPRKRAFKNAPRSLDIDILFFDGMKIKTPSLIIPHPGWAERDFVLIPLMLDS
ncbi:2-amino-4-hydroxy-6-hydroxymethyldihydropteridine diphosphokinase [Wolinella succinogenes]|uniref:2-amino-4-hydroxy-6- hydroxymethyldihydropteridine diphosphokinase n=1 Tax=Wolinella succinogenes TaxID=844 RepID=UPI00240A1ADF|nr:2-amino-4-hydroxy-6-hydroxymethyldihydropteridine diphosphokinase [Wolinella succinogenes]